MQRRPLIAPIAILSTLFPLAACGGSSGGSLSVVRDTIDGVPVVTNLGPGVWADRPETAWTAGPASLRLGAIDGDGPDVFGDIAAVAVDGDRVYVADNQANEVRVFTRAGTFVRRFGRNGEGPGEFGAIDGLAVEADGTVAIRDPRIGRVSRFDPAGELVSTFRLERGFFVFSDGTSFWADRGGRLYDQVPVTLAIEGPEAAALIPYADGAARDTIRVLTYELPRVEGRRDGRLILSARAPMAGNPQVAVGPDGQIAGFAGQEYRIDRVDASGELTTAYRRDLRPPALEPGDADRAISALRERLDAFESGLDIGDVPLPDRLPAYVRLRIDSEGYFWAGRYRGEADPEDRSASLPTEYDVFDATGVLLGSVTVPSLLVMQIGPDFIAGIETDELGIEYAVLLPLERPGVSREPT